VRRIVAGEPRSVIASQLVQLTRAPVAAALTELGERAAALAHKLGREQLAVHVNHDGTRLDRAHWAPFWSACVHAVRNAVDHGIELGDERRAKDKPAAGNLWLSAQHEEAGFVVELRDDGRGIDWAALAQKLRARGLRADTQAELEAALFVDGISTRSEVSETSGRGVGMGALRAAVEGLGGSVSVHSEPDLGTSMRFVFPHSVADTGVELRTVSLKARSGVSGSLTDMDLELDRSEAG